jgi:hypothetical protein
LPIHRVSASAPRPVAFERAAVQRLKGDPRWRKLIREAIYRRHRRPGSDVGVDIEHPRAAFDDRPPAVERVVVSPDLVAKVRTALLKERRPHNRARERFRGMIETQAYEAYLRHRTSNLPPLQLDVFLRALGAQRGWTDRIRRWWPELDAKQLIGDLLADDAALATAGKELFSTTDLQLLHRAPDDQGRQPWTDSDLPLVDEANAQLNGRDKAYGYVIVDEAQDLTPMQLRMVARRTTNGAMTLVGDIAQATGPWRYEHWSEIVDHLPKGVTARIAELTIGFRVPAQVMELATKLLPRIAPGLTAPRAVRQGASDPRLVRSGEDIGEAVCAEVAEAVQKRPGKIGVIVPDALQADIEAHLGSAGIVVGEITRDGLKRQITVLGSSRAKGLEFDTVVVVEPARIEQDARHGTSELYVALTRATQHLSIVYTQALPEGLPQDAAEPPAQPHEQPAVGLPELTGRFTEALIFAKMLHGSQRRRGTAVPFMSHLMAVASLVLEDGGSEDEAVAALLHDAAEDHGGAAVIERVGAQFGEHVAAIVAAVSDPLDADPSTPWRILKEEHLIRLETGSNAARRVALAEKVDNAEAVLRGHRNFGDEIWARLGIDRDDLLWYYRALADLFIREHPGGLARELDALVSDLETRCSPERPPAPRTEDIDTTQAVPL